MTELRATDLRFTPTEAAAFLQAMNLKLSTEDVAALEARTEGSIAGLQLAALSLQGNPDVSAFIQAFAGNHRYIADYLVEEVLQRQPEGIRNFLLQTSILDHLHGPLCDAVTDQQEGSARLAGLERGNFFVVPLDECLEAGGWCSLLVSLTNCLPFPDWLSGGVNQCSIAPTATGSSSADSAWACSTSRQGLSSKQC